MSAGSLLETVLPRWQRRERHAVATAAASAGLLRAAEELTWSEVPLFRALMRLRFWSGDPLARDSAVLDVFDRFGGFGRDSGRHELVVYGAIPVARGVAGSFPVIETMADLRSFGAPGFLLVAINFHCDSGRLRTETRAYGTDQRTRRVFALYWLAVRPWSGLIRRTWLRAIRRRAERAELDQPGP